MVPSFWEHMTQSLSVKMLTAPPIATSNNESCCSKCLSLDVAPVKSSSQNAVSAPATLPVDGSWTASNCHPRAEAATATPHWKKARGATSRWANVELNHNTLIPCFVCIPFSRNNNDPLQTIMIAPLWANHFSPKSWADHTHRLQSRILWFLQLDEGKILCSSVRRLKGRLSSIKNWFSWCKSCSTRLSGSSQLGNSGSFERTTG